MRRKLTAIALSLGLSVGFALPGYGETVLEDIRRTGVLKAGVRQDAPPLGYLSPENGQWQGYCIELMKLLGNRLQQQLDLDKPVEVKLIPSTLENREKLVAEGKVHVECGPNTVTRNPPSGVVYSDRFIATGVYLLVRPENKPFVNPSGALENLIIGVLPGSLTQKFIASRYSLAQTREYPGTTGRETAVQDVLNGDLNAFASDGLLLVGEVLRNPDIKLTDYSLIPDEPLTCEFYGMLVPQGDLAWLNTINSLILVEETVEILKQLYGTNSAYLKTTEAALKKCLP